MFRCSVILFVCACYQGTGSVDVTTEYGPVRGRTIQVDTRQGVTTVDEFRGVPFAKDTSGPRRFRNPEAPDPWAEPFEAFVARDACPQTATVHSMSEDCLHVDIYSPNALSDPGTYPVMVWIHGGAYQFGANTQYPGHFLATHGVVVAVVNHRLGKFGFAYTGNDACPGNAGMWDQQMGLQFVRDNIEFFGGDATRITVFGESAGAGSTALLMMSPQSKDLFQQAILESGAETNLWVVNPPDSEPETYTYKVAEDLGCLGDDDYEMMDCLRDESMESLLENSTVRCTPGYICLGMVPVVDGPDGFLPKMPADIRDEGDFMRGPIMSGIMQDDGAMFVPILAPGTMVGCCNRSRFEVILDRITDFFAPRLDEEAQEETWHALDWNYLQWPYMYENDENRNALVRMATDLIFGAPWDRQIKEHHSVADTFGFVFDYRSDNSTFPEWMGTTHSMELPYVFGYPMLQYNEHIANDSHMSVGTYTDEDVAYSLYFQELFTNFAKYGNPTHFDVEKPFGGNTVWPKFDTETYNVLYLSNDVVEPVIDYRQQDYAFWTEYLGFLVYNTEFGSEDDDRVIRPMSSDFESITSELVTSVLNGYMNGLTDDMVDELTFSFDEF